MGEHKLNTYVHAVELDSDGKQTGRAQTFGPDDDLSTSENEWALAAIGNPHVWAGDAPPRRDPPEAPNGGDPERARLLARIAELEREKAAAGVDDEPAGPGQVPPRSGSGSGAPAWREYAQKVGVEVSPEASREDVIEALEAAGKPTE